MSQFLPLIEKFSGTKILVIGDIMLDRYWWGSVRRISPEAPVPVVNLEKTSLVAGGAANVAANIAGLGAEAFLVGVTGADEESVTISNILESNGITSEYLLQVKKRPTTVKTRIVAHNQHVVRLDREDSQELDEISERHLIEQSERLLEKAKLVLISDYAKGVVTKKLLKRLITTATREKIPVIIDPKGKKYDRYSGAALITPNRTEAGIACGMELDELEKSVNRAGEFLINKYEIGAVLITQGENGMTLFQNSETPQHFKTTARKVYDVTGAGDTVIASLGVAVAAGASLREAAELANISAGLVVEEIGTTTIDITKLSAAIREEHLRA